MILLTKILMITAACILVIPIMAFFCGPELVMLLVSRVWTKKSKRYTIIALKLILLPFTFIYYLMVEGKNVRRQQIEDHYKSNHHVKSNRTKTAEGPVLPERRHHFSFDISKRV